MQAITKGRNRGILWILFLSFLVCFIFIIFIVFLVALENVFVANLLAFADDVTILSHNIVFVINEVGCTVEFPGTHSASSLSVSAS